MDRVDLVLGTMTFGDTVDDAGAAAMVDSALQAGITRIDTANGYAGGESERIVGRLIGTQRERIELATKAGMPHPDAGDAAPLSPRGLRTCIEGSLRRLGTDYVDLCYLHKPDRRTPLEETLGTLAELIDEGKIRSYGVSNYAAWQLAELHHLDGPRPVVAQQLYNLLARRIEDEYVEFAATSGLPTMVYNPLAGGLLTGRHRYDDAAASGRFGSSRVASMYQQRYWIPEMFEAVTRLSAVADKAGIRLVQLAFRWLLGTPLVDSILLGGSSVAQVQSNLDAIAAGPLPADVHEECQTITEPLRGVMPAYNR